MPLKRLITLKSFCRFFCDSGAAKRLRVLGIETSCDDTGVAIVDSNRNIIGESRYSQAVIHALHGGIIPPLAEELHQNNIKKALSEVLDQSKLSIKDLDAIAVTVKPGYFQCLAKGTEYAKDLCTLYAKPLIPIHHMEAHALTVRLLNDVEFPFLVLLTSGGHCILAVAESVSKFSVLGETLDIAPGVLFDRISRKLNLKSVKEFMLMQGGVAVEAAAKRGNPFTFELPFVRKSPRNCNFSFSGYQTAAIRYIDDEAKKLDIVANGILPNAYDICANIQFNVMKYICSRLEIGMRYIESKKMMNEKKVLVVSGGVAANEYFRKMLKYVCDHYEYELMVPPTNLCTDNGVMIAWNGIERLRENLPIVPPNELHSVQIVQKCGLGENLSEDVAEYPWKGRYLNLTKLMKQEMSQMTKASLPESTRQVEAN